MRRLLIACVLVSAALGAAGGCSRTVAGTASADGVQVQVALPAGTGAPTGPVDPAPAEPTPSTTTAGPTTDIPPDGTTGGDPGQGTTGPQPTLPSDLADGRCVSISAAYAAILSALLPVVTGGTGTLDTSQVDQALAAAATAIPAELRADFATIAATIKAAAGKSLVDVAGSLEAPAFTRAEAEVETWLQRNCGL